MNSIALASMTNYGFTDIGKLVMMLRSFLNTFVTKDSTNDTKPIDAHGI
jgi:hypothetical protein